MWQMMIIESPTTINWLIPLSFINWMHFHRANASAWLFVVLLVPMQKRSFSFPLGSNINHLHDAYYPYIIINIINQTLLLIIIIIVSIIKYNKFYWLNNNNNNNIILFLSSYNLILLKVKKIPSMIINIDLFKAYDKVI
jgi:hypothetical protein